MTRRNLLLAGAAAMRAGAAPRSKMGIATTCYMTAWRPRDTMEFLEHAHALGAGGIQASLSSMDPEYLDRVRAKLDQYGMYAEVMIGLPRTSDTAQFERTVMGAKQIGARCVRSACLGGRRYETFTNVTDFQKFITESHAAIDRALPIAEKHRMPLALENHKDWTAEEMAALMKDKSSRWLGVCLDTGNNIALCDDPMEVVQRLSPYTISTHVKDMGVEMYEDGFLLSELPLGEGMLDVKRIVGMIQKARPETHITLEMITRDPLRVPVLTDRYWATFPDRGGIYLARTLRMVKSQHSRQHLPVIDHLPREAQLRLEEDNVKTCLHYARNQLSL